MSPDSLANRARLAPKCRPIRLLRARLAPNRPDRLLTARVSRTETSPDSLANRARLKPKRRPIRLLTARVSSRNVARFACYRTRPAPKRRPIRMLPRACLAPKRRNEPRP